jgi:hypothetical protein
MAHPYALAANADYISIGPCHVYFSGRHLGHTYGGVTVSVTQSVYELKTDQYGETPVRVLEGGLRIEVTVNMTESTFTNLKVLFASATDNTTYLTFGKPVGAAITTAELVLEPTDGSSLIQIYKAAPNIGEAVEIAYTTDKQRVYACKFVGLINDARAEGDQLFRIGGFSSSA